MSYETEFEDDTPHHRSYDKGRIVASGSFTSRMGGVQDLLSKEVMLFTNPFMVVLVGRRLL